MLKIKDSVDLKELEKFGFICEGRKCYMYKFEFSRYIEYERDEKNYHKILKSVLSSGIYIRDNREIILDYSLKHNVPTNINGFGGCVENFDVLYDLIKADLVEKVEE